MIGGQRMQVGLPHAGKTAEITIEADTYRITVDDGTTITAARTSSLTSGGIRHPITRLATTAATTRLSGSTKRDHKHPLSLRPTAPAAAQRYAIACCLCLSTDGSTATPRPDRCPARPVNLACP